MPWSDPLRNLEYNRNYKLAHKAEIRAKDAAYRRENHYRIVERARARRLAHRDEINLYRRIWAKENRDKIALYQQRYRDRKRRGLVGHGRGL